MQNNFVPTTTTVSILICVFCNYVSLSVPQRNKETVWPIIFGRLLGVMISTLFMIFLIIVSNITGDVKSSYVKTVGAWKNEKLEKLEKQMLKSLRPEGVKIAFFTTIQKMTTLNLIMTIIKYTGKMRISFKGKVPYS